jgi:hypothetical protein
MKIRTLAMLSLLLLLTACESWDWRATGHEILRSLCYQSEDCSTGES